MNIIIYFVEQRRQFQEFHKEETFYRISIVLKHGKERIMLNTSTNNLILSSSLLWHKSSINNTNSISSNRGDVSDNLSLHANTMIFPYILFRGVYRIQFHVCDEFTTQDNIYNDDGDIR